MRSIGWVMVAAAGLLTGCGGEDDDGGSERRWAVLAQGPMAGANTAERKATHDAIALDVGAQSQDLGDRTHRVYLAVTDSAQFAAIDIWDGRENLDAFYADPDVQAAFGGFFAALPTITIFEMKNDWVVWGDIETSSPSIVAAFIRGPLAGATTADNQAAHDAVAGGAREQAEAAGDTAHLVFLQENDPTQMLAVDYWPDVATPQAFYANPDLQAAFGTVFAGPPAVTLHAGTDWEQW